MADEELKPDTEETNPPPVDPPTEPPAPDNGQQGVAGDGWTPEGHCRSN